MEKKEKAPVLRFKDTNGKDYPAWEQRKLEDCAAIIMGQSPKSENYTNDPKDHVLVQGNADLKNGQVVPRVWTTEVTKVGKVGDIILSVRAPVGEVGKTAFDVVLGRGVAAIRGNDFLLQTLQKFKECKYWGRVSAGSTFDSITSEILKSTVISMPTIEEQIKIGDFLSSVDNLITLHQRKLEALKKLKRTLLQKMFPKKDQLNPELRFPGFTNDWEQRKLNEIASIYDGTHQTPRYTSNGIPFLSVENITTLQSSKFISEKDFLRDFPVYPKKGDVLLTRIGDVGTANVYERNQKVAFYVSLALLKLRETDPYFVNASFRSNSTRKEVWKRTLHIAFPKKINKNEIGKVNIQIPSLAEQRKIGIFFYSLDRLITLHQRKLETYKKLKKGLLQKMFI
jgi:type I restriction enzyme S subunit